MSKRHGRRGPQDGQARAGGAAGSGAPQGSRPPHPRPGSGPQQNKGPGWLQLRDSVRRDLEVSLQSLSFLERFGEGLDSQRRLFVDFPRITEELRTGAMERLASSLERLYEGGQGTLDLTRFLRDLPLALGHLASAELAARRQQQQQAAAKAAPAAHGTESTAAAPGAVAGDSSPAAEGSHDASVEAAVDAAAEGPAQGSIEASAPEASDSIARETAESDAGNESAAPAAEAAAQKPAEAADEPAQSEPKQEAVSPRVELRTRLLAAAPMLSKAAQAFRRNTATVRRAAGPRRAIGPWRSDREVLDQARRAIEFANKIYDAYAEAWADAPLAKNAGPEVAAEMDRFLAWTQLSRYGEVARAQSPSQPNARQHEAAPGVMSEKATGSMPPPAHEPPGEAASHAEAAPAEAAAPTEMAAAQGEASSS